MTDPWRGRTSTTVPSTLTWAHAVEDEMPGEDVLEVGCGARPSMTSFQSFDGLRVAVDTNITVLTMPNSHDAPRSVILVAADALALPFRDSTFDLVLSKALLTTLVWDAACQTFLAEAGRVLRGDGHLLLADFLLNTSDSYYAKRYELGAEKGLPPGAFLADTAPGAAYLARHFEESWLRAQVGKSGCLDLVRYTEHPVTTASGRRSVGFTALLKRRS